jgi:hypothetical protein
MDLLFQAAMIAATTLVAMTYLGYGLSRLLVPRRSASDVLLWAPFVGYAVMSVVFHALNIDLMNGRHTTVVLFAVATAANVTVCLTRRRLELPPGRLSASLFGITVAAFLIGVAPVLSIGSLTAIGKNYDLIDVYDATAAYVIDYSVASIRGASPPNPLANLVVGEVTMSNGWGLSYLHALASILTGYSTVETQTPVFSLMHALIVPASFLFFHRTMALSPRLAVVLGAGLGLHGALLSMLFIGLGNHIAILTLLPLILASTFSAMDDRRWRIVALAIIMVSNIPLTYWPTFAFFLPAAFAYAMLGARPRRSSVPIRRVAILAVVGLG